MNSFPKKIRQSGNSTLPPADIALDTFAETSAPSKDLHVSGAAMLRAITEASPDCIMLIRGDGSILNINAAGLAMLGATSELNLRGESIYGFLADEHREQWETNHNRICAGETLNWEFDLVGGHGERSQMDSHAVPMTLSDGEIAQLAIARDISERKRVVTENEDLLEAERMARSEAERLGRAKDEFLATLSHELRTPLTAILGWAAILRKESLPPEAAKGIIVIERNARAQTLIIEDLLDMSRIISGTIRLDIQSVKVANALAEAIETVRATADSKKVEIRATVDSDADTMLGDPARVQQIFWNLLSNAVKFTPAGGVVKVALVRIDSQIHFEVIDTGEGINPEFLPLIFNRFQQADSSNTRHHGGLGLGLAITKQLIELHGGTVRASSEGPGKGSRFTVMLPISTRSSAAADLKRKGRLSESHSTGLAILQGFGILVVDDEPDTRDLLRRLLENHGATVEMVSSAAEAMEAISHRRPDMIVSDIGMPGENGYSMMRRYRASEPCIRRVPAVALTAYARSQDRIEAIRAGYQIHVPKPVDSTELLTVVASLAGRL